MSVELKSVNHKFCEVKVRLPRELATLEPLVAKAVRERVARGAVDVSVRRQSHDASPLVPVVDIGLARQYHRVLTQTSEELGLAESVTLRDVVSQPGVLKQEEPAIDLERVSQPLLRAVASALQGMSEMRRLEGISLEADLHTRLGRVEAWVAEVAARSPLATEEYRRRLTDRIADMLKDGLVDPARVAQEVALFAERTDVAEEVTRLKSHLGQFRALMGLSEPVGRKLDFLVQEMHREINTTGSKSQDSQISTRIVELKAEVERIREQVQNIE